MKWKEYQRQRSARRQAPAAPARPDPQEIADTLADAVRAGRKHPADAFSDALGQLHRFYGRLFTSEGHEMIRGAQDALEHVADNDD